MGGVRNRKTRKTKVVKIVGKTVKNEHRAKGTKQNMMSGMLDTSLPLAQSYGKMGVASKAGMTAAQKQRMLDAIPKDKIMPQLEAPAPAPPRPKFVSQAEHGYIEDLVDKYGFDFRAMSRDLKLNPFQHSPAQLRKKILKVVAVEMKMFPDKYEGITDPKEVVGDLSSDGEY